MDDALVGLLTFFSEEEARVAKFLRVEYDLDAAEWGGIWSMSQFEMLATFNAALKPREVARRYRESLMDVQGGAIGFPAFLDGMHRAGLLVPISWDRFEWTTECISAFLNAQLKSDARTLEQLYTARKTRAELCNEMRLTAQRVAESAASGKAGALAEAVLREYWTAFKALAGLEGHGALWS